MRDARPSRTAAWIAACRAGLGVDLPTGTKLCDDPYGMLFAGVPLAGVRGAAVRLVNHGLMHSPVFPMVLWVQLRTRFLDDAMLAFVREGGRQIVILGAGFDCRALRFASALTDSVVYEVDHPATQAHKLDLLAQGHAPSSTARYVPIDFEKQSTGELPSLLKAAGHDATRPTFTIWEGVTMYLTESAIESTVAAIRKYSAPGSELAFTYFDTANSERLERRFSRTMARAWGEPWRWGWDSERLPEWLRARGFETREIVSETDLARQHLPPQYARQIKASGRRIAVATVP
jgi:methyltransferase (TIGR00027 family)